MQDKNSNLLIAKKFFGNPAKVKIFVNSSNKPVLHSGRN